MSEDITDVEVEIVLSEAEQLSAAYPGTNLGFIFDLETPEGRDVFYKARADVMRLRTFGWPFVKIAGHVSKNRGVSLKISDVEAITRAASDEFCGEAAREIVGRQIHIISEIVQANYPSALRGDVPAAKLILDCFKTHRHLLGETPRANLNLTVTHTGEDGQTFSHSAGQLIQELEAMTKRAEEDSYDGGGWSNL